MKCRVMKGNFEIGIIDTDNKKEPIKFDKNHFPAWQDIKFIEIKPKKQEVSDGIDK